MADKYILISFATNVGRSRKLISLENITEVSELPNNGGISIKTSATSFSVKKGTLDEFMSFLVSDQKIFNAVD
jgi:hypothetical protein